MLVGLDFDNTIAGYDSVFAEAAIEEGLLAPGDAATKMGVRTKLFERLDGERDWMRLQGKVYGAYMSKAELIEGVGPFLNGCRNAGIPVRIVSHKTQFGHFDPDRVNLRDAAMRWMSDQGFFGPTGYGLSEDMIFFESTRSDKVRRIEAIGCTHFVDDLIEVFEEPDFPVTTKRYLYVGSGGPAPKGDFETFSHWRELTRELFG